MSDDIKLAPHCSACHNFLKDNRELIKTVWLVPHVVRHKGNDTIITWRCNWGHLCEAGCIYVRAKEQD